MIKLLRYLKGHRAESILGPLFKFLEACFELTVPVIVANMIDVGIKNGDANYVLMCGGIVVFMGLLGFVSAITAQYFAAKASMAFGTELRNDLYRHIASFSSAELDRFGASSLITRLGADVIQTQSGINLILRLLLRSPFIVAGAVAASFIINVRLALILLCAVICLSATVWIIMRKLLPLYTKTRKNLDRITVKTRENLTGARVVRSFAAQDGEKEEFDAAAEGLYTSQIVSGKISALLNPLSYSVVNLAAAALMWFGAFSVNIGDVTQGQIIALLNYMTQILIALLALANLIVMITKSTSSAARINEVFDVSPSLEDGRETLGDVEKIEFKNVSYKYPGASGYSVKDISFTVKRGMTVGIVGSTGSGKSTVASLILREADPTDGEVEVNGRPLKDYTFRSLHAAFAAVPQKASLFSGTVRENLCWRDKNATDEELFAALKTAMASDFIGDDLDRRVAKAGANFSGGQRQRLTIARALVGRSDVLLLDDSASALDYATDAALRREISALPGNKTVFIVSQRIFAVKNADMIIVLDNGRLAGTGTHEELLGSCPLYAEICASQTSEVRNEK
ncbi:MAG: ABC transporter ATP-binding protein [Clostridia bacterium]|nr:ABC transporter ATP-binding protein [Clostridia bacterium]